MERLNSFIETKRNVRKYYKEKLEQLAKEKGLTFFPTTDGSGCWFSGIVLPEGSELNFAKEICAKLKEEGIEARTFWKPIHLQKPYEKCPKSKVDLTEKLWQRIITLPCSTSITNEELKKTVKSVMENLNVEIHS